MPESGRRGLDPEWLSATIPDMKDLEKKLAKWKKYHENGAHCVATLREVNELIARIAELETLAENKPSETK